MGDTSGVAAVVAGGGGCSFVWFSFTPDIMASRPRRQETGKVPSLWSLVSFHPQIGLCYVQKYPLL